MAKTPLTAPAATSDLLDDQTPATAPAGEGDDAVVADAALAEGDPAAEPAVSALPPEVVAQLTRAADNLEAAQRATEDLQLQLTASTAKAVDLQDRLDIAERSLASEVSAHAATRAELARAFAGGGFRETDEDAAPDSEPADWIADGLYVMKTSKIPDETGALAPRGRLAIVGEKRADELVEQGHARPATRADVIAAKRPPVRL